MKNIKNYIIPKPWGHEYLFFENQDIGIWFLSITLSLKKENWSNCIRW
jgi:hypothetical protein